MPIDIDARWIDSNELLLVPFAREVQELTEISAEMKFGIIQLNVFIEFWWTPSVRKCSIWQGFWNRETVEFTANDFGVDARLYLDEPYLLSF